MRTHGEELHTKEDTHGGDVEIGEDVLYLSRGRTQGATVQSTQYT